MRSFFKETNNPMDWLPSQKNFHVPKIVHIIYWLEYEVFLFFLLFLFFVFSWIRGWNLKVKHTTLCFCKKEAQRIPRVRRFLSRQKRWRLFWKPRDLHIHVVYIMVMACMINPYSQTFVGNFEFSTPNELTWTNGERKFRTVHLN